MAVPRREVIPTIYYGTFVHTNEEKKLLISHNTAVGVDAEGIICFVEQECALDELDSVAAKHNLTEYIKVMQPASSTRTSFFIPGFIDTHIHAPQYPNVGVFGNTTLLEWLNTYTFPLESSFSDIHKAATIYSRVVARSLANGTTCAAYYATIHVPATSLLADICLHFGQRALIGRVCMDRNTPEYYQDESTETTIRDTKAVIEYVKKIDPLQALIRPVITPRFAISCTNASLTALGQLHKETGHFVQTHISENFEEIELTKDLFPSSENYASVYDEVGLLTDKTILAHAVHLTADEVKLISERQGKIAHCPASNTCLTSGAAPVRELLDMGITLGLGTDVSGGYSPSILEMVRQAMLVSRHVAMGKGDKAKLTIDEALWLATRGGAQVVGLETEVGSFEVGKHFDAQLIFLDHVPVSDTVEASYNGISSKLGPVDIFGWESWEDRLAKWVYRGDDRNVAAVWIKGRLVHDQLSILSRV